MKRTIYILLILIATFIDCKSQIDIEIDAINDIFGNIVDYGQFFRLNGLDRPQLDTIYDSDGNVIGYDTEKYKTEIKIYNKYYSDIKSTDTSKIVLAVVDTLFPCWRYESVSKLLNDTITIDYYEPIKSYVDCNKEKQKFDLDKIANSGIFLIRNRKEFPDEPPSRSHNYNFSFSGYFAMSRVYFNSSKTRGVLFYIYLCGSKCGNTNLLLIERENDNWKIDKIKELGVF
jgi:hypothetical protein